MTMSEDKILKYCIKYDAICKFCPRQLQWEKELNKTTVDIRNGGDKYDKKKNESKIRQTIKI